MRWPRVLHKSKHKPHPPNGTFGPYTSIRCTYVRAGLRSTAVVYTGTRYQRQVQTSENNGTAVPGNSVRWPLAATLTSTWYKYNSLVIDTPECRNVLLVRTHEPVHAKNDSRPCEHLLVLQLHLLMPVYVNATPTTQIHHVQ